MLIIDQHAAHERILFEQLKAGLKERGRASQMLMLPLEVMMTSDEIQSLSEFREEIEAIGFAFVTKPHAVEVNEIPEGLKPAEASELLLSLADALKNGTGTAALARDILFEKALYQSACKAAIKGGREYPPEYIQWLCEQLQRIPDITVCPHGRPVAMELTHAYIDHQFKRA